MKLEQGLKNLPVLTQGQILDEINYAPAFAGHIVKVLDSPDPFKAVYFDMVKALTNEFDRTRYPEMKGLWSILRAGAKQTLTELIQRPGVKELLKV